MARQVKCPYCEQKFDKEDAYQHGKKYYHPECFETWQREGQDYNDLKNYICELYKVDVPNLMVLKQIKEFKASGYKYKGMELALRYFFDTLGNRIQEGQGVGIIPYIYEEAKMDYIKQQKIVESTKKAKQQEEITVYINPEKNRRKSKKIDINAIQ